MHAGVDEQHMTRALELAASAGNTSPNPRVGCVIARGAAIVGSGRHEGAGTAHAEVVALASCGDARGATAYVTLEPCVHQGRTPPCAPALHEAGIERAVIAIEDPDERVAGRGLDLLRAGGVEVVLGVLADEARALNDSYLHHRTTGRPLLRLKLALSLDGRLAAPDGSSRWITGSAARRRVHSLRAGADAVLIGAGTAAIDDPSLTVRDVPAARQPARVVVDARGRVPVRAALLGEGEVVVATTASCPHEMQTAYKEAGAEVLLLPTSPDGVDLAALLDVLGGRGWLEVLCEGGARLATSLVKDDLVQRLEIHLGPLLLGAAGPEIGYVGVTSMTDARRWRLCDIERAGDDCLLTYERKQ